VDVADISPKETSQPADIRKKSQAGSRYIRGGRKTSQPADIRKKSQQVADISPKETSQPADIRKKSQQVADI
jgi:hypothetical protein